MLSVTSVITRGSESATTLAAVVVVDLVLELTSVSPLCAVSEADAIDKSATAATALVLPATISTVVVLLASVVVATVDSLVESVDPAMIVSVIAAIAVPAVVGLSVVVVVLGV